MDKALDSLINQYSSKNEDNFENILKEIVQHLALLGLWRAKFFQHAAFYGGTALRIFYGLRRFSEDLDFSLLTPDKSFSLDSYLSSISKELEGFGFEMTMEKKNKSVETQIESAFIKGNTIKNLLTIDTPEKYIEQLPPGKKLKIKLEIDTNPPPLANYDVLNLLLPIPFQVKLFSQPDLFAGKIHAVLCREWKERVKGRDLYDFLWYLGNSIPCHLAHLKERMIQTNHWQANTLLDKAQLIDLLTDRFGRIDIAKAKKDVSPFIRDQQELTLWSNDYFIHMLDVLNAC